MTYKEAEKLPPGATVLDKVTGESIKVICTFEEPLPRGKKCIMIEGTGEKQGYNHWQHTTVR
jgi:hypothetical protein